MMGRQKTKGRKVKKPPEQLIKQPYHRAARSAPLPATLPFLLLASLGLAQATPPARRPAAPAYRGDLAADFDEWLAPGAGAPKAAPHLKVMTFYGGTCVRPLPPPPHADTEPG